jgi:hypothetical protein
MMLLNMQRLRTLRSGFLLFVLLLTVGLGAFIFFSARSEPTPSGISTAPTQDQYRDAVRPIVANVQTAYPQAGTDAERGEILDGALAALLDVRVPTAEKDTHLELAVSLQLTRSGLTGDRRLADDGWERFLALVDKTDWLK